MWEVGGCAGDPRRFRKVRRAWQCHVRRAAASGTRIAATPHCQREMSRPAIQYCFTLGRTAERQESSCAQHHPLTRIVPEHSTNGRAWLLHSACGWKGRRGRVSEKTAVGPAIHETVGRMRRSKTDGTRCGPDCGGWVGRRGEWLEVRGPRHFLACTLYVLRVGVRSTLWCMAGALISCTSRSDRRRGRGRNGTDGWMSRAARDQRGRNATRQGTHVPCRRWLQWAVFGAVGGCCVAGRPGCRSLGHWNMNTTSGNSAWPRR